VLICSFLSNAILIPIAWIGLALCLLEIVNRQRQRLGDGRVEVSVESQDVARSRSADKDWNNLSGRSNLFEGALLSPEEIRQVQDSEVDGQGLRLRGNN
jgi:hypothetical protein